MANITLGELRNLWKTVSDWVSGTGADVPAVADEDVKEAIEALQELIGEVSAAPTSNTLLERVKQLQVGVAELVDWVLGASADVPAIKDEEVKEELETLQGLIGEVSAEPTPNTLLERIQQLQTGVAALSDKIDDLTDGNQNLKVTLSGAIMELFGATIDSRPQASTVPIGATFMAVKTQEVWQSDGTDWVVM